MRMVAIEDTEALHAGLDRAQDLFLNAQEFYQQHKPPPTKDHIMSVNLTKSVNLSKNVRGDHFIGSRDINRKAAKSRAMFVKGVK